MVLISKIVFDNVFDVIDKQIKRDKEVHAVNTTFLSKEEKYRKNDIRKVIKQLVGHVRFNDIDTSLAMHIQSGYYTKITTNKGHSYYTRTLFTNLEESQLNFHNNFVNQKINKLNSNIDTLQDKQIWTKQGRFTVKNKEDFDVMIKSFEDLSKYYTQLLCIRENIKSEQYYNTMTNIIQKTKKAITKCSKTITQKREGYEIQKLNQTIDKKILSEIYL